MFAPEINNAGLGLNIEQWDDATSDEEIIQSEATVQDDEIDLTHLLAQAALYAPTS